MSLILLAVVAVLSFVAGILVGRNNKAKVEAAVMAAETAADKVKNLKK